MSVPPFPGEYAVLIKVEHTLGQPGDEDEVWWEVASYPTREEAIDLADDIVFVLHENRGITAERLDA